jgi:hypothetical protein
MSEHEAEDWGHEDCSVCEEARADSIAMLRAENERLREDAARLDFWQANPLALNWDPYYHFRWDVWHADRTCTGYDDIREAIDAARKVNP